MTMNRLRLLRTHSLVTIDQKLLRNAGIAVISMKFYKKKKCLFLAFESLKSGVATLYMSDGQKKHPKKLHKYNNVSKQS